jgi:hypothetical protein
MLWSARLRNCVDEYSKHANKDEYDGFEAYLRITYGITYRMDVNYYLCGLNIINEKKFLLFQLKFP